MSSNEKRWLVLLGVVIIIAVVIIVGIARENNKPVQTPIEEEQVVNEEKFTTELSDGTKINTSEEFNNVKTYKDLEISNIQYTEKNGMSVLLADVTNKGNTTHEVEIVKITILGENGEEITQIKPAIGKIEPGETIKLNASITADVANAKDFKIESVN